MYLDRVVGACKECCHEIKVKHECLPDYKDIYECPSCGHPHHKDELFLPVSNNIVMLAETTLIDMRNAGDTLTKHLGLHSQALKAVEEGAEFSQALLKFVRCKTDTNLDKVFEEYFDALATSTQVIRMLAGDNETFMRLQNIANVKLNKLEDYAELAKGFKSSTEGAYELEQFQKLVESKG